MLKSLSEMTGRQRRNTIKPCRKTEASKAMQLREQIAEMPPPSALEEPDIARGFNHIGAYTPPGGREDNSSNRILERIAAGVEQTAQNTESGGGLGDPVFGL